MGKPVVHFEVVGSDGAALRRFYGELFDWNSQEAPGPMDYGLIDAADAGIAGGIGGLPDGPGHVTFYVQVPDLQAALDRVEELGGRTVMPPEQAGPAEIAHFADPQGQVVGLVKGEDG
jgi:uncharacterized protein